MEQSVKFVKFPPLQLHGTEADLVYPTITYAKSGPKLLLISDTCTIEDIELGQFCTGDMGNVIAACMDTAIEYNKKPPQQVMVVSTQIVRKSTNLSDQERAQDLELVVQRTVKIVAKYKPDSVVLLGFSKLKYWMPYISFTDQQYSEDELLLLHGRLLPCSIGGHDCMVSITFSPRSFASVFPEDFKTKVNLIGFVVRALETAIRGNNLYNLSAISKTRIIVRSIDEFDKFFAKLIVTDTPAIDTETNNLNRVNENKLLVLLFTLDGHIPYLIPYHHPDTPFSPKELLYIKNKLKWYFEFGKSKFTIYHNAKFDITQFYTHLGLRYYNHRVFDTMSGAYGLDENSKFTKAEGVSSYTLEGISAQHGALGYKTSKIKKADRSRMAEYSLEDVLEYGAMDTCYIYWIARFQIKEAKRRGSDYDGFFRFVTELCSDMTLSFVEMEVKGALVDKKYIIEQMSPNSDINRELREHLEKFKDSKAARAVNDRLKRNMGVPSQSIFNRDKSGDAWVFDISKVLHQQMLFFQELKLPPLNIRKDGGGAVDKMFLNEYKDSVPEVQLLIETRKRRTLFNTYIKGIFKLLISSADNYLDNRLRATYTFVEILTTRSAARKPSMQNIPSRDELAKIIKRLFIPICGNILIDADFMAHEVKAWGNISHDKAIAQSFAIGLCLRRKMRIMLGKNPQLDHDFHEWLYANWKNLKTVDEKRKAIKRTSNDKALYDALAMQIDLDIKGDVHRVNYELFFGVPAEQVTKDQRTDVKAVVFGVIYEKKFRALARDLYMAQMRPILQEYAAKLRMYPNDENMRQRIEDWKEEQLKPYHDKAKDLINTLFTKFKTGGDWIRNLQAASKKTLRGVSVFGAVRHLWGHLHSKNEVRSMMDRRGPNSAVQGAASNMGFTGARAMQTIVWNLLQKGIDLNYIHNNVVHDSVKTESNIAMCPLTLYYMEHSLTSKVHEKCRKTFNFTMDVALETEFEIGGAGSRMEKFDFTEYSLLSILKDEIAWMQKELGYKLDAVTLLDAVKHNWRIVNKYRIREMEELGDSYIAYENIMLTPEIAATIPWKGIKLMQKISQ